jgi:two-component system, chemotaxis family, chemotaxis protein CheY
MRITLSVVSRMFRGVVGSHYSRVGLSMAKRVLIVDDNRDIRMAVRQLLEAHGQFEVCGEAANGKEAIAKANLLNPDLMVLDLSMPVMNGMEAARVLKKTKPALPIILFTLHGDLALQSAASELGIRAVVSKTEMNGLVTQAEALFKSAPRFQSQAKVSNLEN